MASLLSVREISLTNTTAVLSSCCTQQKIIAKGGLILLVHIRQMENNDEECYDDGGQNSIGYVNNLLMRETQDISSGASTTALEYDIVEDV